MKLTRALRLKKQQVFLSVVLFFLWASPAFSDDPCTDARLRTAELTQTLRKHESVIASGGQFFIQRQTKDGVPVSTAIRFTFAEHPLFLELFQHPDPLEGGVEISSITEGWAAGLDLKYSYGAIVCNYRILLVNGALQMSKAGEGRPAGLLSFPLKSQCGSEPCTAYNAEIVSVIDHAGTPLDSNKITKGLGWGKKFHDGVVRAYTGETGTKTSGVNCEPGPGYKNVDGKSAFRVNGYYHGTKCDPIPPLDTEANSNPEKFLNYDGHSGYDFRANEEGIPILAPAPGCLHMAKADPINHWSTKCASALDGWDEWHTYYIDHANGFTTWYLHAKDLEPSMKTALQSASSKSVRVERGQIVASVGSWSMCSTVPTHLHFEVRQGLEEIIDPYPAGLWRSVTDRKEGMISVQIPRVPDDIKRIIESQFPGWQFPRVIDARDYDKCVISDCKNATELIHPYLAIGDFDGDGKKDYAVSLISSQFTEWRKLQIVAILSSGGVHVLHDEFVSNRGMGEILSITKKGTEVFNFPPESPVTLTNDSVDAIECEKGSVSYRYDSGIKKFRLVVTGD